MKNKELFAQLCGRREELRRQVKALCQKLDAIDDQIIAECVPAKVGDRIPDNEGRPMQVAEFRRRTNMAVFAVAVEIRGYPIKKDGTFITSYCATNRFYLEDQSVSVDWCDLQPQEG